MKGFFIDIIILSFVELKDCDILILSYWHRNKSDDSDDKRKRAETSPAPSYDTLLSHLMSLLLLFIPLLQISISGALELAMHAIICAEFCSLYSLNTLYRSFHKLSYIVSSLSSRRLNLTAIIRQSHPLLSRLNLLPRKCFRDATGSTHYCYEIWRYCFV